MTASLEGKAAYVPSTKESAHDTTSTSSAISVDVTKADGVDVNGAPVPDATVEKSPEAAAAVDDDETSYLPFGPTIVLITISLMMAVFCVALDNTVGWMEYRT